MTAPELLAILGRLHPLVLHLPIGLLVGLGVVEAVAILRRRDPGPGLAALVWLNAGAGAAAAATGFLLSREPGYGGGGSTEGWRTIDTHMWLGIAVGICGILLAAAYSRRLRRPGPGGARPYRIALAGTLALLLPTGHLGGEMTHGAGFVLEPLRGRPEPVAIAAPGEHATSPNLNANLHPVLAAYCLSCHGETKQRGGLALHTPAAIAKGGESGPVIVVGDAAASELLRRLRLPAQHDDRMPPAGKRQPTPAEIEALAAWIDAGLPSQSPANNAERIDEPSSAALKPNVPEADPAAIEQFRTALVHVQPVHRGSTLLRVDFAAPASTGDVDDAAAASLLGPVIEQVAELSLAGSEVTDDTIAVITRMPRLRRLDLRGCAITDRGVAMLAAHRTLEELNLVGTRLTDAATAALLTMPALARLYIWNSGITPDGASQLRSRSGLRVDTGDLEAALPIETEPTPRLSSDAPPHDAAARAPLAPTNTTCPVSGKPVDPRYTIIHKGNVIGLCCPKCAEAIWKEPALDGATKPVNPAG